MPRVLPWLTFGRGKKQLYGRTLGSGLGWSVGAAIGIKMAKPNRQTVCLVGDGAFLMGQIEALWAARRFDPGFRPRYAGARRTSTARAVRFDSRHSKTNRC